MKGWENLRKDGEGEKGEGKRGGGGDWEGKRSRLRGKVRGEIGTGEVREEDIREKVRRERERGRNELGIERGM